MEKDTLDELRALSTAARRRLAQVRRNKCEDSCKPRTQLVSQHIADRRTGIYTTPDAELLIINKILDSDDLAPQDRKTFSQRRRILLKRLTTLSKVIIL